MEQQPRRVHSAQRYDVVITTPYHYLGEQTQVGVGFVEVLLVGEAFR